MESPVVRRAGKRAYKKFIERHSLVFVAPTRTQEHEWLI